MLTRIELQEVHDSIGRIAVLAKIKIGAKIKTETAECKRNVLKDKRLFYVSFNLRFLEISFTLLSPYIRLTFGSLFSIKLIRI